MQLRATHANNKQTNNVVIIRMHKGASDIFESLLTRYIDISLITASGWRMQEIMKIVATKKYQEKRVRSNSRPYDGRSTDKWTPTGKQGNKHANANTDTNTNVNTNKYNVEMVVRIQHGNTIIQNRWG